MIKLTVFEFKFDKQNDKIDCLNIQIDRTERRVAL